MILEEQKDCNSIRLRDLYRPQAQPAFGSDRIGPALDDGPDAYYIFACFRLYPRQRRLLLGTLLVAIGDRTFDILLLLVSNAGSIVTTSVLKNIVWPGIKIEETNLRVQISMVRKLLARCSAAKRAIDTIALRGYCFILPVHRSSALPEPQVPSPPMAPGLPLLPNRLIGRDDAVATLCTALEVQQLVTITGPGGVGKTMVAIVTASRYAETFRGDIVMVDLFGAVDGAEAVLMIAEKLDLQPRRNALVALCDDLRSRSLLLILDTCEHIADSVASICEVLATHAPNLKFLITSQKALLAAGEWIYRLQPLIFPAQEEEINEGSLEKFSAITLFKDRVSASTRFLFTHQNLAALGEISRRLDGNPLALECAAARVTDLGLSGIAAHLDDRFAVLDRGRRNANPRHRTLAATFDHSYALLSGQERRFLHHLSSLGRSFTAENTANLGTASGREQVPKMLRLLYEKSIITVDTSGDFSVYHLSENMVAYLTVIEADAEKF